MKENSIKEDIKDIEKYISFTSKRENFSHDTDWNWNKDLANKIEHILSDYKRVLKENEELKKLMAHKNWYTQKLEEDLFENASNYVIKKQKVKEKIKEIGEKIKYEENEKVVIYLHKQKNILQEVLKESEE